ncbi:SDR family NAD(P)-dependent oxidoreductase [Paenibacillus soyae]|uniref:SDR family NAD(P)-dependent oxidoreductase n=1 Tax=Paenibacillus soyae TaxID=2969249 RepID=A0A9X2MTG0_9BACL|nr:SDR family NAD(P)-dependent oxidoreductase [Paenibacillus soyae]MCR2805563.1 SDR family NAD(P)-dependent oxidoreductase [Paenibacillus soyae]
MKKWAFVTGADRGVGLSLVKRLLERDYLVFGGQYSENGSELTQLEASCQGKLKIIPLDIGDPVDKAAESVYAVTDRLDILINNAAILGDIHATIQDELDFEEIERVFRVNALGSLRMSNKLMGLLLASESKLLVNISSEAGSIGNCWRTAWFGYCMSKASLNMQSMLIHNEIAPLGGKVIVLHPGHVQTFMQGKLDVTGKLTPDESSERIMRLIDSRLEADPSEELTLLDEQGIVMPW